MGVREMGLWSRGPGLLRERKYSKPLKNREEREREIRV